MKQIFPQILSIHLKINLLKEVKDMGIGAGNQK
jgi:hypothetical protein